MRGILIAALIGLMLAGCNSGSWYNAKFKSRDQAERRIAYDSSKVSRHHEGRQTQDVPTLYESSRLGA